MIADELYLIFDRLDDRQKRRLLRLIRRQMRLLSKRRVLKALLS
jgi:hypothetical protein